MKQGPRPIKTPLARSRQIAFVLAAAALTIGGLYGYAVAMFKQQAPTLIVLFYSPMAVLFLLSVNLALGSLLRAALQMAIGTAVGIGLLWGAVLLWLLLI